MKDPYEVLGVQRGADKDTVKAAYRALAKKYHPDQYTGSPLEDLAKEKMQEINEAYDAIMSGTFGSSNGSSYSNAGYSYAEYSVVEDLINRGQLDEAERILDAVSSNSRNARWYFLKGEINQKRGWTQQAYSYYSMAHNMEPDNYTYTNAFNNASSSGSGGFRTNPDRNRSHRSSDGCCDCCGDDGCDLCTGLLCADCCCECLGGDLISCC